MEPPNKNPRINRITNLPETLIHHITSYLSLKDIARMSISSKTWRSLCYTTPFLTINLDELQNRSTSTTKGNFYSGLSFVERMLVRRNGLSLQRFSFTSDWIRPIEYSVETWILSAINCNVQELDLFLRPRHNFPILPGEVFTHSSLRVLKLFLNGQFLKLPSSVNLPKLEILSLILVKLPENPLAWVSTGCPSLRTLTLDRCCGFDDLNVTSSSIEVLNIVGPYRQIRLLNITCPNLKTLDLNLASPSNVETSLTLSAPNLQSFTWFGRIVNQFHSSTFTSLQCATITISYNYTVNDGSRKVLFAFWNALLAHLNGVKSLSICSLSMLTIASIMILRPSLSLGKTEYLKLYTHLSDVETCMIMLLFWRSPDMKTLVISQEKYYNSNLELNVQVPKAIEKFRNLEIVHHLKMAELRLLGSGENNLELVKYLLKNAKQLEKITILYSCSEFDLAKKISQKLPSSSVGIYLVPV